jgi:hypothetical protein
VSNFSGLFSPSRQSVFFNKNANEPNLLKNGEKILKTILLRINTPCARTGALALAHSQTPGGGGLARI